MKQAIYLVTPEAGEGLIIIHLLGQKKEWKKCSTRIYNSFSLYSYKIVGQLG